MNNRTAITAGDLLTALERIQPKINALATEADNLVGQLPMRVIDAINCDSDFKAFRQVSDAAEQGNSVPGLLEDAAINTANSVASLRNLLGLPAADDPYADKEGGNDE